MQKKAAFAHAFRLMSTRINLFLSLPLSSIDQLRIKEEIDLIGRTPVVDSSP
jgi:arsenate reductase